MTAPMPELRLARPRSVGDAIAMRREHAGQPLHRRRNRPPRQRAARHRQAGPADRPVAASTSWAGSRSATHGVRIGAGVTIAALARDPVIASALSRGGARPPMAIAGPGHRGWATVGGNLCLDTRCIYYNQSEWWRRANGYCLKHRGDTCHVAPQGQRCHAAFTGDLAPALLALGAEVEIAGTQGRRRIPLGELYVEDGRAHLALAADELVVAVHLPQDPPPSAYAKVRVRGAIDYPAGRRCGGPGGATTEACSRCASA